MAPQLTHQAGVPRKREGARHERQAKGPAAARTAQFGEPTFGPTRLGPVVAATGPIKPQPHPRNENDDHDIYTPYIGTCPIIQTCRMGRSTRPRKTAVLVPGTRPMMAIMAAVMAVMGVVLGWWITAVITAAVSSRSQERVQRAARHWQQTARARTLTDRLADDADAHNGLPPERDDWPLPS
jgi:hypothetical protein